MIVLSGFPKNRERFVRLMEFFKEVLAVCDSLNVFPIVDGSLAVFAYTKDQNIDVNDIDTSVSEADFPKIVAALEEKGINYELKEWHVLRVLKGDLRIELGSLEYWLKELPNNLETLKIDGHEVEMLTRDELKRSYEQVMETRLKGADPNDKIKYERLKEKYSVLNKSL